MTQLSNTSFPAPEGGAGVKGLFDSSLFLFFLIITITIIIIIIILTMPEYDIPPRAC